MKNGINYYDVFNIHKDDEVAEVVEPQGTLSEDGEKEQEAAATANGIVEENAEDVESDTKQSNEENSKFASMRRKFEAEQQTIIAKIKKESEEKAQETINDVFKRSNMENPYTGKKIETKEDYDEYIREREKEEIENSGVDVEVINKIVAKNPAIRAIEKEQEQRNREKQESVVKEQITEIGKLNSNIKSIDDLRSMKTYDKFYELVMKGNTFVDAYKIANLDSLISVNQKVATQAAMNAQSKQHLESTAQKAGSALATVPKSVYNTYKNIDASLTDREIAEHYTKYLTKKKG